MKMAIGGDDEDDNDDNDDDRPFVMIRKIYACRKVEAGGREWDYLTDFNILRPVNPETRIRATKHLSSKSSKHQSKLRLISVITQHFV